MAIKFGDKVTFEGAVLTTRERNWHDDSDFYAVVWNDEKKEIANIEYDSTRYAGGGTAWADATPEVVAKANAYAYAKLRRLVWGDYLKGLRKPEKGDMVTVVAGRKVPKGTKGRLFWVSGPRYYGGVMTRRGALGGKTATKVGIALTEDKDETGRYTNVAWTYLENLDADIKPKFKLSEIKYRLKRLKVNGWGAWVGYMASLSGLAYI